MIIICTALYCNLKTVSIKLASSFVDPADLNAGLQDQRQALRFLRSEVGAFGGDPDKVRRTSHLPSHSD